MIGDPLDHPKLQTTPHADDQTTDNKYSHVLRDHTLITNRPFVHVDSPDLDLLCQAIHQQVIKPFLVSRSSVFLEKCCWSFSKPTRPNSAKTKFPHDNRLKLNTYFPPKMPEADVLDAIKSLLLSVGEELGRLKDGLLEVPFVNLPHLFSLPPMDQDNRALREELEVLKKRDAELFSLANPLINDLASCAHSVKKMRTEVDVQEDSIASLQRKFTDFFALVNYKFVLYHQRLIELEHKNKDLGSKVSAMDTELLELKMDFTLTKPAYRR